MSEESVKNPPGSNNTFAPSLIDYLPLPDVKLGGNCIKEKCAREYNIN